MVFAPPVKLTQAVGVDVELDQEVAAGGDHVGVAWSRLGGEGDGPRIGEEQLLLAGLGDLGAEVQVEGPLVGLGRAADAADDVEIGLASSSGTAAGSRARRRCSADRPGCRAGRCSAAGSGRPSIGSGNRHAARGDVESCRPRRERHESGRLVGGDDVEVGVDVDPADQALLALVVRALAAWLGERQEAGDEQLPVVLAHRQPARLEVAALAGCTRWCAA